MGGGEGGRGVLQMKRHFLGTTSMFMSAVWNLHTKLPQQAKQENGKGPQKDICVIVKSIKSACDY